MKVKYVSMAGADDRTKPIDLISITKDFPYVEWAILAKEGPNPGFGKSGGHFVGNRYPSIGWTEYMFQEFMDRPQVKRNLSKHLCGEIVRNICKGFLHCVPSRPLFNRIQLNFPKDIGNLGPIPLFHSAVKAIPLDSPQQVIFQVGNTALFSEALEAQLNVVPLFDSSRGHGELPEVWPEPYDDILNGYAGGLGPHNLEDQLKHIEDIVGDRTIWIDMETHLRSNKTNEFDIKKVVRCLEIAANYVE